MNLDSITFESTGGATRDDLRFIFYKINKTDKIWKGTIRLYGILPYGRMATWTFWRNHHTAVWEKPIRPYTPTVTKIHFQNPRPETRPPELVNSRNLPDLLSIYVSSFSCKNIYRLTLGNVPPKLTGYALTPILTHYTTRPLISPQFLIKLNH